MKRLFISSMLCLVTLMATAQSVSLDKTVITANCWATNKVIATSTQQNAIAVYQNFVYLTYYDATTRKLTIARNNNYGVGTNWVFVELPHTYEQRNGTWDNHNTPNIIVSPNDGRIHLAFDMHAADLRYIISSPGAATVSDANFNSSLFGPTQNYLESNQTLIDRVTYPRFFVGANNKLFFMYRDGGSGNGHTYLVKYRDDGYWDAPVKIIEASWDGSTRCAYFNDVHFKDGRIYLTWVWRASPDGATNHDLMFMYSDDNGVTWKNSAGSTQSLPINFGNSSIIVSNIGQETGLANHNGCAVDGNGNVHVVLRHGSNYNHHIGINNGNSFSWSEQTIASFTGDRPKMYANPVTDDVYFLVRQGSNNSLRLFETPSNGGLFNQWSEIHSDADSYMTSTNSIMNATGDELMSMVVSTDNRLQLLRWTFGSGGGNNPPSASITSPADGSSFNEGDNITISADAADSDGSVTKVEFFQGSTKLGEDLTSPYSYTWSNVAAGSYSLTAVATDDAGATGTSAVVSVSVIGPNVNPITSITSPSNGASFVAGDNVTINADASDSDGSVSKVEFFQGATKLGEDLSAPYSYTWNNVAAGNYDLTTVATDDLGGTGTSAVISISVATGPPANVALNKSVTVSSEQSSNPGPNLVDGDPDSRWSASGFPQWAEVDLGATYSISSTEVICYKDRAYQFIIEGSTNGSSYWTIVDRSSNTTPGTNTSPITDSFSAVDARYVRISVSGASGYSGSWVSLEELRVFGVVGGSARTTTVVSNEQLPQEKTEDLITPSMKVYPNPTTDRLNIILNKPGMSLKLYDFSGRIVMKPRLEGTQGQIRLDGLQKGLYFLEINDQEGLVRRMKVIKN